jgi:predicted Zn-dependent protease
MASKKGKPAGKGKPARKTQSSQYETYVAKADKKAALKVAKTKSPFQIEVRFIGGLNTKQKNAFKKAADRWCRVIVGDLPSVQVDGEVIDDLLILAEGTAIDGEGSILGQAGPTRLRPKSAGKAAYLPAKGEMQFDTADLKAMEKDGSLNDVICHEMGHVLGIGTIWDMKNLLKGANTSNPTFKGANAMKEYGKLRGTDSAPVPVESKGGAGTRDSHWRDTVFANELMTGFVSDPPNPMSRMTVASLQDMGYVVNVALAEKYKLPNHLLMAEAGAPTTRGPHLEERGVMLPNIPMVLPDDSLV